MISEEDLAQARPIVVVNRAFVNKYFAGKNPLGQQVKMKVPSWFPPMKQTGFEVVGVVADTAHYETAEPAVQPQFFLPYTVAAIPMDMVFVRTAGNPAQFLKPIRQEFAAIDRELVVGGRAAREDLEFWYTEPRFVLTMMTGFAVLGLVLVSVGVYSVLSYAVSRRRQEIGIRMALGAEATDVRRMVMTSGLRWLLVGIAVGVPASMVLAKILQNRVWGIKSADPLTLVAVSLLLTVVGLAACYFPARRATKVDPMIALRNE